MASKTLKMKPSITRGGTSSSKARGGGAANQAKKQKHAQFAIFHDSSHSLQSAEKESSGQQSSSQQFKPMLSIDAPANNTSSNQLGGEPTNILQMLEDTGGSSNQELSIFNIRNSHLCSQKPSSKSTTKSNLLSFGGINITSSMAKASPKTSAQVVNNPAIYIQKQQVAGTKGKSSQQQQSTNRSAAVVSSMSQFSRDRSVTDVTIRGRKLSPTTELGNQKTVTGTDSGVHLTVMKTEQDQPLVVPRTAATATTTNKPLLSYSSEYVGYPAGNSASSSSNTSQKQHILRSQRQTRSSSLLQQRQLESCQYTTTSETGVSKNAAASSTTAQMQTAKFAGQKQVNAAFNQYSAAVAHQQLKQSQSMIQIGHTNARGSTSTIGGGGNGHHDTTAKSRERQSKLIQKASLQWLQTHQGGTTTSTTTQPKTKKETFIKPNGQKQQVTRQLAKEKSTNSSALLLKPPKLTGQQKVAQKQEIQQPKRPKTAMQQSTLDGQKKKRSSLTPTGPAQSLAANRKPNAVTNQKLMPQQRNALFDIGMKSNSLQHRGQSKQKSAANLGSQHYRSTAEENIKVGGIGASSAFRNQNSRQQRSQMLANPQVLDQRNESGGTGEILVNDKSSSFKPPKLGGCSSSSSPANRQVQQQNYVVVEEPNLLKNSKSSFQLTFSQRPQTSQKTAKPAENDQSHRFTIETQRRSRSRETLSSKEGVGGNKKKGQAASHSPRDRQQSSIVLNNARSQGEALKMFKQLQKKVKEMPQMPPYLNQISSKSVIEKRKLSQSSQSQESRSQQQVRDSSEQKNRNEHVKLMKKLLENYQKSVIKPAQVKLQKRKDNIKRELTPTGRQQAEAPPAAPTQSRSAALDQNKREKKEQKQRVRELRQKRKAIEAKTREMKLKSIKQAHVQLHNPTSRQLNQGTPQTSLKVRGGVKSDLQNIINGKAQVKTHVTPSYTIVRSSIGFKENGSSSKNDLLDKVAFQQHINMPLQMKVPASVTKSSEPKRIIKVPRDASNSSSRERVEWEPLISRGGGAPLRQKQTGKPMVNNLRKRESLGLEIFKVKKQMASELPLSSVPQPKKLKTVTPVLKNAPYLKEKGSSGITPLKKRTIHQQKQQQIVQPRILDSEQYQIQSEKHLKVEDSHRKKTLEPQILESDRSIMTKEKQKKLVEHQKRVWLQKEKVEQMTQLSEQQRILKNLHKVNKVARVQAMKAIKKQQASYPQQQPQYQKMIKSARGSKSRPNEQFSIMPVGVNYQVTQFQEDQYSPISQNERDHRFVKIRSGSPEKVFNVQIRSVTETISASSSNNNTGQREAYSSPMLRQPRSGTTGAAESDTKDRRKSGRSIRSNAVRKKTRQDSSKESRVQLKLNPATLYQLSSQEQNGLTYDDHLRQSSLSQRQSMCQSSNLNYSPTTTIGQRSNSHSTNRQGRLRSESSNRNRNSQQLKSKKRHHNNRNTAAAVGGHHNQSQQQQLQKSNSSKAQKRKANHLVSRDSEQKRHLIQKFKKNSMTALQVPKVIKERQATQMTLDPPPSDDMVIYFILTQAAQVIQKNFRGFICRKKMRRVLKANLINEIESELERHSQRSRKAQKDPNVSSQIQSVLSSMQSSKNTGASRDVVKRLQIVKKQSHGHQARKHTFSFGTELHNQASGRTEPASILRHKQSLEPRDLSGDCIEDEDHNGLIRNSGEGQIQLLSGQDNLQTAQMPASREKIRNDQDQQNYAQTAKETAKFHEKHVNFPDYDQQQHQATIENQYYSHCVSSQYDEGLLNMEAGSEPQANVSRLTEEQDSTLQFERVSPPMRQRDLHHNNSDEKQHNGININDESQEGLSISVCSEDIRSHIFAEAGEDLSLQNIIDEQQRQATEESMMIESVKERTDMIINYSGALNTSEDFIQGQHIIQSTFDSMLTTGGDGNTDRLISPYSIQLPSSNKAIRKTTVIGVSQEDHPSAFSESPGGYASLIQQQKQKSPLRDSPKVQLKMSIDQSRRSLMRVVSGDEKFLINHSGLEDPYYTQGNTSNNAAARSGDREAIQMISELQSRGTQPANQSMDEYQIKTGDNSFQNAMYPQGSSQSSYLQQNLSQVSLEHSKDSLSLLKQGYGATQSSFLHTNASIFERNPFQDFTASKLNALFTNGRSISGGKASIESLIQVKEDALKFISQLEKGWIARQEKMSLLTPRASKQKRYELEQWVSSQNRKCKPVSQYSEESGEFDPSASQIKRYQTQVQDIVEKVNRKADEIREQLYQRSQDQAVRKQQIEGYQSMHLYKKALGITGKESDSNLPTGEIKHLNNIDVIDQSQEEIHVEDQVDDDEQDDKESDKQLEISKEEETSPEQSEKQLKSPPSVVQHPELNADIPSQSSEAERFKEQNERLSEEITDRILAHILEQELRDDTLTKVFERQTERTIVSKIPKTSPGGSRVKTEPFVEVAVTSDANFKLDQSISADQIIAGVDTSIEAVEQYIEGIFSQIRVRAKQFMNAFYTPIYRNPMAVLTKIQKQGIGGAAQMSYDSDGQLVQPTNELSNTLSSILNVQLYLTLEKARENVIRDALQQIKESAQEGEDLAINSNLSELLSESDHIHNKAIFDTVNEALNMVRPYGRMGEPMPWSTRPRKNFFPYADEKDLDRVLDTVKKTILEWTEIKAGQISSNVVTYPPENETKSRDGGEEGGPEEEKQNEASVIKQAHFKQISEETLALQREKSLARLLTHEIKGQEERWLDYETQETQVKIDVTDHILEQLVEEIAAEMTAMQAKGNSPSYGSHIKD